MFNIIHHLAVITYSLKESRVNAQDMELIDRLDHVKGTVTEMWDNPEIPKETVQRITDTRIDSTGKDQPEKIVKDKSDQHNYDNVMRETRRYGRHNQKG